MDTFNNNPNVIYKIAGLEDTGIKKLMKTEWDDELESAIKTIPYPPLANKVKTHLKTKGASLEMDLTPNQVFGKLIITTETTTKTSTFTKKW